MLSKFFSTEIRTRFLKFKIFKKSCGRQKEDFKGKTIPVDYFDFLFLVEKESKKFWQFAAKYCRSSILENCRNGKSGLFGNLQVSTYTSQRKYFSILYEQ